MPTIRCSGHELADLCRRALAGLDGRDPTKPGAVLMKRYPHISPAEKIEEARFDINRLSQIGHMMERGGLVELDAADVELLRTLIMDRQA